MTRTSGPSRASSSTINPRARLVDLTHAVPPQDIRRAALLLEAAWRFFPRGSVHLAVVDPGVGGARRPIAVEAGGHYFVGPDNGLLGFCFDLPGARGVVLTERAVPSAAGQPDVPRPRHLRARGRPLLAGRPPGGPRTAAAASGAADRGRAPAARRPGRRGGPAGRPLREPADEPPGAGAAGAGRARASCGSAGRAFAGSWAPTPSGPGGRSGR